ncbi:uncharacterized protein LOC114528450 [Dendronephthya gigantea]|uniref:uncharacterized protein LOC114528450 n=1 Tax=Dendronephthya gigantea TaxID=151771 RepID=UPI00106CBBA0|nr:uncharacterized protein LOC114528450 [Dendronephthya gigantea]
MITKCPMNWPLDNFRRRCESAPSELTLPVEEDNIPVVSKDALTYRNQYCALCHGIRNYTAWDVKVYYIDKPPEGDDLNSLLKSFNWSLIDIIPRSNQPGRICFGKNYIDSCGSTEPSTSSFNKSCVEDSAEFLEFWGDVKLYFRNKACAFCNGYQSFSHPFPLRLSCGSKIGGLPLSHSLVFKLRTVNGLPPRTVVAQTCPSGTVYDTILKFCRRGYIDSSSGELTNVYLMILWCNQSRGRQPAIISELENVLKQAIVSQFSLHRNQISQLIFHNQDEKNNLLVVSFHLTLTPSQNLILENQDNRIFNVTSEEGEFLRLLNSKGNFTLSWKENGFFVTKMISKRLSCYGGKTFKSHEYKIAKKNGSFFVEKTGEVFSLKDYALVEEKGGNITLCRKLVPSDCRKGAYVPLRPNEYVVLQNLSVYYNATGNIFNFGEYLIDKSKNDFNVSSQNLTSSKSSTISVCLPFRDTFNATIIKNGESLTNYELRILTLIGFIISIICLFLLLVTYGWFRELRTVPGMNLMNLGFSMLLSDLIWLIGTSHFTGTITCKVFAILEHYLFQVSFLAMSVISYHSCLVFARPFAGRHVNTSWRRFSTYSGVVWLTPAVFVAICVTLDETGVFSLDYGTNCWLGTFNGILYLFLSPLAISLLYNIYTFIKTACLLLRDDERRDILQRKEGKQNLLICIKLASLVGFPWLFAFLGVLFPDEIAFEYLFVIFVCLQGLYIGVAFLFTRKTLDLYKKRWNIGRSGKNTSYTSAPTFEMT